VTITRRWASSSSSRIGIVHSAHFLIGVGLSGTGAYKQAVAGAAKKILSEHRLENLSALHRLQPE
jgi:hypothetical protein